MKIFRVVIAVVLCVSFLASCQSSKSAPYGKGRKQKPKKCNTCPKWDDNIDWASWETK